MSSVKKKKKAIIKKKKGGHIPGQKINVRYRGWTEDDPDNLPPLTEEDLRSFRTYEGEAKITNQMNKICIRVFKQLIPSQVHRDAVSAIETLFRNLAPVLKDKSSFHHGSWRAYEDFAFFSSELLQAQAFYQGTGYPPLWQNEAFKEIGRVVDGRFGAMTPRVAKQYRDLKCERFYTKSFTMCVINKGVTTPHYDYNDEPEGYCCVVPLGKFDGGDLVFREHKIRLAIKPGDLVFFHSRNLLHENLAIDGVRYSLVLTTHHNLFTEFGQAVLEERIKTYEMFIQNPLNSHARLRLLSDEDLEKEWQDCQKKPLEPITREIAKKNREEIVEKSLVAVNHKQSHGRHSTRIK